MRSCILYYWGSKKAQLNIFWEPKYGFIASEACFRNFLIEFLCCLYLLFFFCNRIQKWIMAFQMTSYRILCDHKHVGFFQLRSNGFHDFEINFFRKIIKYYWNLTLFLFLSTCYLFLLRRVHILHPHYWRGSYVIICRSYVIINVLDVFNCYLMLFITLKSLFLKIKAIFFNFSFFVCFCLFVAKPFNGVVPYFF